MTKKKTLAETQQKKVKDSVSIVPVPEATNRDKVKIKDAKKGKSVKQDKVKVFDNKVKKL